MHTALLLLSLISIVTVTVSLRNLLLHHSLHVAKHDFMLPLNNNVGMISIKYRKNNIKT